MDRFPGFPKSLEKVSWQFPTIINGHVHELSGSEFKVLWYILRHTFGWQKSTDKLSISQICNGIKKRNGEYLDKGTGLSNRHVIKALKSLEKNGFILIKRTSGKTNEITLNITNDEMSLVTKGHTTSDKRSQVTSDKRSHTINNIPINNINNNTNTSNGKTIAGVSAKEFGELMDLFKNVNPSHYQLFGNKTQRASLERMITKHGYDKMQNVITRLPEIVGQPYAPVIT